MYIKVESNIHLNIDTMSEDPTNYTLKHLTDQNSINHTRYQNAEAWKGQLSAEKYVERDLTLSKSKLTSGNIKNQLYVFALHKTDLPDDLLCSVELLVRDSWKYNYNETTKLIVKEQVLSGCIGGVYTIPHNRGKGLAKIMIDKLVQLAKVDLIGENGFIFLYSEIGEYYSKCGFKSFEVPLTYIPLVIEQKSNVNQFKELVDKESSTVELIEYHDFEEVYEAYSKFYDEEFTKRTLDDHKERICVSPDANFVDWFHLRSKYVSHNIFHKSIPPIDIANESYEMISLKYSKHVKPNVFGIKLTEPNSHKLIGFISWTHDWSINDSSDESENYVTILNLYVERSRDHYVYSKKLIDLCISYLQQHSLFEGYKTNDLKKITIWELETSSALLQYLVSQRNGRNGNSNSSMSCMLIFDDEEQQDLIDGKLIWELNNKLPWF